MHKPNETPQTLSYPLTKREFVTTTPMGNWYSMRDDRDRWRRTAEALAVALGDTGISDFEYENQDHGPDFRTKLVGDEANS